MIAEANTEGLTAAPPAPRAFPYGPILLLMLVYVLNMLDRQIVTLLVEPMKRDLQLADWQIGAISGLAFALFYTVLGIPLARVADRGNRVHMIAGSLAVWSAFTMLCGVTRNFGEMLLARVGVGVGEAGCTPAAHSLITDYVPRERRASALALYTLGIPLGSLAGLVLGGVLLATLGWRSAFFLAGAPGLILAVIVVLALKEPRRVATAMRATPLPLATVLRMLRAKRSYWCVSFSSGFAAFAYYGQAAFFGSLYMRTHAAGLAALAADWGVAPSVFLGVTLGLLVGIGGGLGTLIGGWLADRIARRGIVGYVRLPTATLALSVPLFAGTALSGDIRLSFALLGCAIFVHALNYGSAFAAVQTLAAAPLRAMASAIQLFLTNAIGLAFGPLFVGVASDWLSATMGPVAGLRTAMALVALPLVLASVLFALAARTIVADEAD